MFHQFIGSRLALIQGKTYGYKMVTKWLHGAAPRKDVVFLLEKNWRHGVAVSRIAGTGVASLGAAVLVQPQVLGWLVNVHA